MKKAYCVYNRLTKIGEFKTKKEAKNFMKSFENVGTFRVHMFAYEPLV